MDGFLFFVHLQEIIQLSRFARIAYEQCHTSWNMISEAIENYDCILQTWQAIPYTALEDEQINRERMLLASHQELLDVNKRQSEKIWYSIQSFVTSVGNISKILWGPYAHIPSRPQENYFINLSEYNEVLFRLLLREILTVEVTSSFRNRETRNGFEHFDEWLIDAVLGGSNIVDKNIGPLSVGDNHEVLRGYDPETDIINFAGKIINMNEVMADIANLEINAVNLIQILLLIQVF